MSTVIIPILIFFLLLTLSPNSDAGNNNFPNEKIIDDKVDNTLANLVKSINVNYKKSLEGNYDDKPLNTANQKLTTYLLNMCSGARIVFKSKLLQSQKAGLDFASSDDGLLKLFTWDTLTGGTMHYYKTIALFVPKNSPHKDGAEYKSVEFPLIKVDTDGGDSGLWYGSDAIKQINTKNNKTVYLLLGTGIYSTIDHGSSIQAVNIDGNNLKPYNFFKTKTKTLNSIECDFHEDDSHEITLSNDNHKLLVPLLNEKGVCTGKNLVYEFDGSLFVYSKVE